jgi:endonuclease YncB( thermonuclease family)
MRRYACRMTLTQKSIFLTLALYLGLGFTCAETIVGNVVGVVDGDTVTVLDADKVQHNIRLSGIDAPEKAQPFGQRSKENLSNWVFNKQVTVEIGKTDRYGRSLGKVLVEGVDANLEQVKAGFAWHYKAYEREQPAEDRKVYARAEAGARAARAGLWRDAVQMPPWDWRSCRRKQAGTEGMNCGLRRR